MTIVTVDYLTDVVKGWYEKFPNNDDLMQFLNNMVEPYRTDPQSWLTADAALSDRDKAALYDIQNGRLTNALTDALMVADLLKGDAGLDLVKTMIKANTVMLMALVRHITTQE